MLYILDDMQVSQFCTSNFNTFIIHSMRHPQFISIRNIKFWQICMLWGIPIISRLYQNIEAFTQYWAFNSLRPRQNGRHFADDTFKCIFLNENVGILIKISLKFVPKVPINNIPALVQVMAWRRTGDKPLTEAMVVRLLTHICVTRPQWVKSYKSQNVHSQFVT